jgi:hypothetical protein
MEEFSSAIEVENKITNAEEKYFDGNFASLRAAAKVTKYHVPYSRLYTRQHIQPSKVGRPGPNKQLFNPEKSYSPALYLLLRYLQNAQQNTGMLECYKDTI